MTMSHSIIPMYYALFADCISKQAKGHSYDADWRLLEERVDENWDGVAAFAPDRLELRVWCPLYIDGLIATETDTDDFGVTGAPDGDYSDGVIRYALYDRLYSVIGLVDITGDLAERVRYTAYGEGRVEQRADLTGDGLIDGADQARILVLWNAAVGDPVPGNPPYNPDVDLNQDGAINGGDLAFLLINWGKPPHPRGAISNLGNTVGYDGYLYDNAVNLSLARHRWLDHGTGRWGSRDPLGTPFTTAFRIGNYFKAPSMVTSFQASLWNTFDGGTYYSSIDQYINGGNLSEYSYGSPVDYLDPSGLSPHNKKRPSTLEKHQNG